MEVKLTAIGNSLGIRLPKEAVQKLNIQKGESLHLIETKDGFLLTPFDPDFEETLAIARQGISQYKNTLRELAK